MTKDDREALASGLSIGAGVLGFILFHSYLPIWMILSAWLLVDIGAGLLGRYQSEFDKGIELTSPLEVLFNITISLVMLLSFYLLSAAIHWFFFIREPSGMDPF